MTGNDEFFISIDIEADGPIPGPHSMLQLGAAFYDNQGILVSEFLRNIQPIEGASPHPKTQAWWAEQEIKTPGLMKKITDGAIPAKEVMLQFDKMVRKVSSQLGAQPVVIAYPAGFDFTFLYWYLVKFVGQSIVGFSALDMKSQAAAILNVRFRQAAKRNFPRTWFDSSKFKHTHVALDDAKEQGHMFFCMQKDLRALHMRGKTEGRGPM